MKNVRDSYSEELASQYLRMERLHNKIVDEFESQKRSKSSEEMLDDVYTFFTACYHLREWINKDAKVGARVKAVVPKFFGENAPVQLLICRDLANKSKHSVLETKGRSEPNDPNTRIESYGGAVFLVPTQELSAATKKGATIHLKNEDNIFLGNFVVIFRQDRYDLKGVVQGCMYVWKTFFADHKLLLPRNTASESS